MGKKRKKLQGSVQKIIRPLSPDEPEKAQIEVRDADDLYRELRFENEVADEHGGEARLKRKPHIAELSGFDPAKRGPIVDRVLSR